MQLLLACGCGFVPAALVRSLAAPLRHEVAQQRRPTLLLGVCACARVLLRAQAPGLPKTRSGKIMRRVLRKIASKEEEQLGDTSTLADPGVVQQLVELRGK